MPVEPIRSLRPHLTATQSFAARLGDVAGGPLALVIAIAVAVRLGVFAWALVWPIPNESLFPVSPLNIQGYPDFAFYLRSLEQYRTLPIAELFAKFVAFYQSPFEEQFGHIIAGPFFPALMELFDYRAGNTLPMALFYLVLDCAWAAIWLKYLSNRGMSAFWQLLLAIAPNPVWFMLVVSPDLVFALLVALFFYFYMRDERRPRETLLWVGFLLLILLTRPNGYSVLLFVLVDFAWRNVKYRTQEPWGLLSIGLLALLFGLYLYPYFITEMRKTAEDNIFFGLPTSAYAAGLFRTLPEWLDLTVSWAALAGAKTLYFVGLRPSYGATSDILVAFRALAGLVLLPGLVVAALRAPMRERLFLGLFFLPIFLGPTQDRYNLPIYPLLFYYGSTFYDALWARARRLFAGP